MTRIFAEPLRRERDYDAAIDRLATLEEEDRDDDEAQAEAGLLGDLIDHYETEDGVDGADDDFELDDPLDRPAEIVATFKLVKGPTVEFLADPAGMELACVERGGEAERVLATIDGTPFEAFMRLARYDDPIPAAIARCAPKRLVSGRRIVETLEPREVSFDLAGQPAAAAAPSGSYAPDPAGAEYFETHHCGTSGGPGYGKAAGYCFPNSYTWIQKTSPWRCRATYTRMIARGSGACRLTHRRKKAVGWRTHATWTIQANDYISAWSYRAGVRQYRRVHFDALSDDARVRGWVKYHQQVAT
jgi:hypothetical protein